MLCPSSGGNLKFKDNTYLVKGFELQIVISNFSIKGSDAGPYVILGFFGGTEDIPIPNSTLESSLGNATPL